MGWVSHEAANKSDDERKGKRVPSEIANGERREDARGEGGQSSTAEAQRGGGDRENWGRGEGRRAGGGDGHGGGRWLGGSRRIGGARSQQPARGTEQSSAAQRSAAQRSV